MHDFVSTAHAVRIHSGARALDALPAELQRAGVKRPLILCGQSVARRTTLIHELVEMLGHEHVSVFDGITKEGPLDCVLQAVKQAREYQADGLIAIGAGTVLKTARVVAILMTETAPIEQLITQYPVNGPAIPAKLHAKKVPIMNVLTAPTTAQFRGGSAVFAPGMDHRLEFFDPKTRPRAIFWDARALRTAPVSLMRTTGGSVYWRALMNMAGLEQANPLVQASRRQAYLLATSAMSRISDPEDDAARIDLCAAALLQNRDEDDGGQPMQLHWISRMVYALAASLFTRYLQISQGEAHSIVTARVIRHAHQQAPEAVRDIGRALGLEHATPEQIADAVDQKFTELGLATRLSQLGITEPDIEALRDFSMKSFNADRNREFVHHAQTIEAILKDSK